MSRNKFHNILRILHFTSEESGSDKAIKIRPVIKDVNFKFTSAYKPGENIVVDENLHCGRVV